MFEAFILTTGWLFWVILGLIILFDVLALSTEDESMGGWAIFLSVTGLLLTIAFTDVFVGVRLVWLAVGIFAYCILGVVWSFKKWVDFILEQKRSNRTKPLASGHKTRIVTSMAMWPFQLSWWVLTWPRQFFIWAYNRLAVVYDRITNHLWES